MNLTTALAILAGLVLLGIVVQGAWAARKALPRQRRVAGELAAGSRQEPSLEGGAADTQPMSYPDTNQGFDLPAAQRLAQLARRSARIDALIDAIAAVTPEAPVTGDLALQHLPTSRRAGGKPLHVEGLNAETGEWEQPQPGQRYGEFQAAVQLANRNGALNEIEYSEFVQKIQQFADGLGAVVDFPDMLDVVARARELDSFASQHDAQLGAVLRTNSVAWGLMLIQQSAARHGFVAGAVPGRMVLPAVDDAAPPVLVLAFDSQAALADDPARCALREVSLSFDVPQTAEASEPFALWQECARRLADDLDATLVDDRGAPITLHAYTAIGQELGRLYQALDERDLSAGSAAARRLFS
jgi:FtsZ-interacting cell division protein ZipA